MEKIKEKLRMLVKPIEFAVMIGLPIIGLVFGGVNLTFALLIIISYVVLQLTGWGTKHVQDAIDGSEKVIGDIKEDVDEIKRKIDELLKR
jgi:low affinity Fe/Cu permease